MSLDMIDHLRRRAVLAALVVVTLTFYWPSYDRYSLPKLTVLLICALAVLVLGVVRVIVSARLAVPVGPVPVATMVFAALIAVATLTAPHTLLALLGTHERRAGALLYWTCALLLLVAVRLWDRGHVQRLLDTFVFLALPVALYALFQAAGGEFGTLELRYEGSFSTLGNPNYAGAWLGMTLPLVLGAAVMQRARLGRLALWCLAAIVVGAVVTTRADQGFVASAAGMAVFGLGWVLTRGDRARRVAVVGTTAAMLLGLLLIVPGLYGQGPAGAIGEHKTLELRRWYWDAAGGVIADNPVVGVGFGQFGGHYRAYRPVALAVALDFNEETTDAHNVPLQLAAEGGVPLSAAYVAVMVLTALGLGRAMWKADSGQWPLVGAVGGAWVAYQLQSLVSINVPTLAVSGWLLTAAIVVLAGDVSVRDIGMPWKARISGARRAARRNRQGVRIVFVAGLLVWLVLVWVALIPIRGARAVESAVRAGRSNAPTVALEATEHAISLIPWEHRAWFERGRALASMGDLEAALDAFTAALRRAPRDLSTIVTTARIAERLEKWDVASRRYAQALAVDPIAPDLKVEAGKFYLSRGEATRARELAEAALELEPGHDEAAALRSSAEQA